MDKHPAVRMNQITKSYGPVQALRGADFCAFAGEVTAIVGDNGSGKSTLMKILCGAIKPDGGSIRIGVKRFGCLTPHSAEENGISAVYQDLALDNSRDCAGNIFLGREPVKWGFWLDLKSMYNETQRLLSMLDIDIQDLHSPVGSLSGGQRQAVAIARIIHRGAPVMIFDEPTSAMGPKESAKVLRLIKGLKEKGVTVIMISHNLFQVFDISDRISIMAGGRCVSEVRCSETSPQQVHDMLVDGGRGGGVEG